MSIEELIYKIEALDAEASPSPWVVDEVRTSSGLAYRIGTGEMLVAGKGCCIIYDDYPGKIPTQRRENADLIALAREAAPLLARALRETMQERDALKTQDTKQRQELIRLRQEHKDVLDCAVADDPNATDGINGWAKRVTQERDRLRKLADDAGSLLSSVAIVNYANKLRANQWWEDKEALAPAKEGK